MNEDATPLSARGLRWKTAAHLGWLIPLGFLCKYSLPAPLTDWGNQYGAAIVYEVFWVLLVAWVWPTMSSRSCALWVFGTTCFLETAQLWDVSWLNAVRPSTVGSWFFGTTFDAMDFFYYAVGCAFGWLLLTRIRGKQIDA